MALQLFTRRAEGEAIGGDHVAQDADNRSVFFGGKIRLHGLKYQTERLRTRVRCATLGSTAKAHLLLAVRCTECRHRANVDPAEQAERYGADLPARNGRCG